MRNHKQTTAAPHPPSLPPSLSPYLQGHVYHGVALQDDGPETQDHHTLSKVPKLLGEDHLVLVPQGGSDEAEGVETQLEEVGQLAQEEHVVHVGLHPG